MKQAKIVSLSPTEQTGLLRTLEHESVVAAAGRFYSLPALEKLVQVLKAGGTIRCGAAVREEKG